MVNFSVYLNRRVFVMFAFPIGVIGRLCSMIVTLLGPLLYCFTSISFHKKLGLGFCES